jgi:hypothetical protein
MMDFILGMSDRQVFDDEDGSISVLTDSSHSKGLGQEKKVRLSSD